MVGKQQISESDPFQHTSKIKRMLEDLIYHARENVAKVDDPRAQALFETTAEVLIGLKTAYEHFESGKEPAFRR
jgi:hypothetical protein